MIHIPPSMQMHLEQAHALIEEFSFGVLVSEGLQATHLPFLLERNEGEHGTLYGHLARANPHGRGLHGQRVLTIFNGPHAYISPTWYAKKPAVPTWNYAVVHAEGTLELLDSSTTNEILDKTLAKYEPELLDDPETLSDALRDKLLPAIVGVRIRIHEIHGKAKLGQHRSQEDQAGVAAGLRDSDNPQARQLWRYMQSISLDTEE
ncbi:hypothetical protein GCM10007160_35950 [Litchfieldella qijiaojingensis]|uniref:FMN-binding negative transcriptional regulator n=1 Tax=Litchfieldella qijiaojingensis TaxID=980347 RepID=A0ABQ2Z8W5_9GAMM|nr:FMN-binding negative transcriptional regulator [Halomonas qijiaojingensis]GGY05067.1 hypothetical protein GCM10007160_35950 [Halomonas qijiaojingensis]